MNSEKLDLVCFGEILYDIYDDKKVLAGAPLNTASIAAAMGLKSAMISAVGKDDSGVEEELLKREVKPYLQKDDHDTGKAVIKLDENKVPSFHILEDSAYDYILRTEELEKLDARFFCFGTLGQRGVKSRETLRELLEKTKAKTIYDINIRKSIPLQDQIIKGSLKYVDVLKLNDEELVLLQAMLGCKDVIEFLFDNTKIEYVFVTSGGEGASLYQKGKEKIFVHAPEVKAQDTTGCGDAFTAMVVYGFVNDIPAEEILERAVGVASKTAQYKGAFDKKEFLNLVNK